MYYAYIYRDPGRENEPIYVGKGKNKRAWVHLQREDRHPFVARLKSMRNLGIEPYIEIIPALDEGHALFLEECLIEVIGRKDLGKGPLLNLTDGGDGVRNYKMTVERRQQISEANRGRVVTAVTRAKISTSNTGKKRSPESVALMTKRNRESRTPEVLAKISASKKGCKAWNKTPEWKVDKIIELRQRGVKYDAISLEVEVPPNKVIKLYNAELRRLGLKPAK